MQAMNDYEQAEDRTEKPFIVRAIISHTYSSGGRFLRRCDDDYHHNDNTNNNDTTWVELNFQEQKDKVRHALRDAISEMKMKQKKSLQCRHQESSFKNGRSKVKAVKSVKSDTTIPTTPSNIGINHVTSMSSVSNQRQIPMEMGVGEGHSYGDGANVLPLPSSTTLSTFLNVFPSTSSIVAQHLLRYSTVTTPLPSTLLNVPSSNYVRINDLASTNDIYDDDDHRLRLFLQLSPQQQLHLLQRNNLTNQVNQSIAMQIYNQQQQQQQLQMERQLVQNFQNSIAMNAAATTVAVQRNRLQQLQALIANLQNDPSQPSLW
jgi:hypothetical protein